MFGIGMPEMLLILAVALIVIGPKKLPDLAKSLGRAIGEFKKATSEFKETLAIDNELKDVKKAFDDINDNIKETITIENRQKDKAQNVSGAPDKEKSKTDNEKEELKGSFKDE